MRYEALIALSDDELYAQIGGVLIVNAGGMPDYVGRASRAGRAWVDANRKALQLIVCPKLEELTSESNGERVALVAAVADLIASYVGAVPAFTVAALMVRMGLSEFCGTRSAGP